MHFSLHASDFSGSHTLLQQLSVSLDGRIDNADELASKVHLPAGVTIDSIIIALYKQNGIDTLFQLEGAFSLILHDAPKHRTVLYRSFLNGYPLYYVSKNNLLSISSNPVDLLHRSDVSDRLDTAQISSIFALELNRWNTTVFSDLNEVEHGEIVVISSAGITSKKRALQDALIPLEYGSETEIIERYRQQLDTTLAKHIRPGKQYGIMLSSGIDSASLALLASRQLKLQGSQLRAYSWSFPSYQMADESKRIRELCAALEIELTLFNAEAFTPFAPLANVALSPDAPFVNLYWEMTSQLYQAASADGIEVLFNGHYGDHLYAGPKNLLIDILKRGHFKLFMPTITSLFQYHGLIGALKRSPILRGFIRYLLPFYRSKRPPYYVPEWLSSDARVMQKMLREESISAVESGYEEFASALSKLNTSSGIGRHLHERHGIERIEPYFDPKLINYTLRLPLDMVYRNGQVKYFAREAMRDLLPESIRTQSRVGVLNQFANDGFINNRESLRQRLFDDPEPWRAYVDEKWLAQKLKKNAKVEEKELLVIWMSLTFSQWQRAIKPGGDLYEGCLVKG